MRKKVIIIGAGYGGMALANMLGKAGYQVDVFEKNAEPGGRIAGYKKDGFMFDIGPSWYLMPEVFEQYYQLFGATAAERLDLVRLSPGYKVFFENEPPITIAGDLQKDAATFEQYEHNGGAKLRAYVKTSTLIYTTATKHFLYTNFQRLHELIKPEILLHAPRMLGMIFKPLDSYVSRYFKDARLKKILEYHMVFLGSSPYQAPAIYTLMSHLDFNSGVFYPRKGMLSLASDLKNLGEHYNINYHTGAAVASITVTNGNASGVQLADGRSFAADIVVSNADLHFTETQLLAAEHQSFPERYWKKRQAGPSGLLINLGIRGQLPQLQHHTLLFVDQWRKNFAAIYETMTIPETASMYICNPNKTDPSLAPEGTENLFVLMPLPSGVNMDNAAVNDLVDRAILQISRMINAPDLSERIVVKDVFGPNDFASRYNAWANNAFGGESHVLKQSIIFRTPNKSRKVKNLYYVGAGTTPGIGLPMCLMSAHLIYKRIMGIKTGGPIQEIQDTHP